MRRNQSKSAADGGFLRDGGKVKWPLEKMPTPLKTGASAGPTQRDVTAHVAARGCREEFKSFGERTFRNRQLGNLNLKSFGRDDVQSEIIFGRHKSGQRDRSRAAKFSVAGFSAKFSNNYFVIIEINRQVCVTKLPEIMGPQNFSVRDAHRPMKRGIVQRSFDLKQPFGRTFGLFHFL